MLRSFEILDSHQVAPVYYTPANAQSLQSHLEDALAFHLHVEGNLMAHRSENSMSGTAWSNAS